MVAIGQMSQVQKGYWSRNLSAAAQETGVREGIAVAAAVVAARVAVAVAVAVAAAGDSILLAALAAERATSGLAVLPAVDGTTPAAAACIEPGNRSLCKTFLQCTRFKTYLHRLLLRLLLIWIERRELRCHSRILWLELLRELS